MFEIAILIGIYSYLVFALGLSGWLYPKLLAVITGVFLIIITRKMTVIKIIKEDKTSWVLVGLIFAQALVNLVGALGPELGFDALWYHLTLPKIYLQNHRLVYIPGNLLYYSTLPKLLEMLYVSALAFQGEILAKIIHFIFGVLSAIGLYKLSRRYLRVKSTLIVVTIFYTALVVGWQSITAYVDLARTFFEILALDYFLKWYEKERKQNLIKSALMIGLAISTKLLALGSLIIFLFLIIFKRKFKDFLAFSGIALLVSLPWLVFSFIHTRNPVYPIFGNILDSSHKFVSFNIMRFISDFWNLFLRSADPISPIILIFLPLFLVSKLSKTGKVLAAYCLLAYVVWYFTPRIGGGRFFLPYLPAFSLLCGFVFEAKEKQKIIRRFLIIFIIFITVINVIYRGIANKKYLPVILGRQTKADFLKRNLNFKFGDFYDVDGFFKANIDSKDLVLIYGIHNLYYVDFPFVHESWARPGTPITHILVKDGELPKKFGKRMLIYYQPQTNVRLYLYGEKLP